MHYTQNVTLYFIIPEIFKIFGKRTHQYIFSHLKNQKLLFGSKERKEIKLHGGKRGKCLTGSYVIITLWELFPNSDHINSSETPQLGLCFCFFLCSPHSSPAHIFLHNIASVLKYSLSLCKSSIARSSSGLLPLHSYCDVMIIWAIASTIRHI